MTDNLAEYILFFPLHIFSPIMVERNQKTQQHINLSSLISYSVLDKDNIQYEHMTQTQQHINLYSLISYSVLDKDYIQYK